MQVSNGGIEASWAGGEKGREVTDRFLPRVGQLLSSAGIFYLIVIKENVIGMSGFYFLKMLCVCVCVCAIFFFYAY